MADNQGIIFPVFYYKGQVLKKLTLNIVKMGLTDYKKALADQQKLHSLRAENKIEDTLLLLEHNNVITLGRRGRRFEYPDYQ